MQAEPRDSSDSPIAPEPAGGQATVRSRRGAFPQWIRSLLAGATVGELFNSLVAVIVIRTVFDALLGNAHTLKPPDVGYHEILLRGGAALLSSICLFLGCAALLAVFVGMRIKESLRLVALIAPLTIAAPFIDYFQSGRSDILVARTPESLGFHFIHLFDPFVEITAVSLGTRIEVLMASLAGLTFSYYVQSRGFIRSLALALGLYVTILTFRHLPAATSGMAEDFSMNFFLLYIPAACVAVGSLAIVLVREDRRWLRVITELVFPTRLMIYVMLLAFGVLYTGRQKNLPLGAMGLHDMTQFALAVVSIALLFAYSKLRNDFFDRDIDRVSNPERGQTWAVLPIAEVASAKGIFLIPSFIFALAAEPYFFPIWLLIHALAVLYSEPPMRLRRFYPVGHVLLALIGASVFMGGGILVASGDFFQLPQVPPMAGGIFLSFFCISHIKDLKDIDGDTRGGVMNVYALTASPKVLVVAAICSFSAMLILCVWFLGISGPYPLTAIGVYLLLSVGAVVRASDIRKLDWLLRLALAVTVVLSMVWLRHSP